MITSAPALTISFVTVTAPTEKVSMMSSKQPKESAPTRDEDEVLRRMLATKPTPHKAAAKKTPKTAAKKSLLSVPKVNSHQDHQDDDDCH